MPSSVTDRPTDSHEYLFLLTKKPKYFYDQEAIREENATKPEDMPWGDKANFKYNDERGQGKHGKTSFMAGGSKKEFIEKYYTSGRNKRSVWTIPTQAMSEAHFATFPEKLVEPCILAGTSARGNCPQCGKPWERVVEKTGGTTGQSWHDHKDDLRVGAQQGSTARASKMQDGSYTVETTGWRPTCDCGIEETRPGIVLDPFGGSGTVGVVAGKNKRDYVLIELSAEYAETIARPRLAHIETAVPVAEARAGQLGLFP